MATLPLIPDLPVEQPPTSQPRLRISLPPVERRAPAGASAHPPLIASASSDAWTARIASRMDAARRHRARTRVAAIDAMLETLEQRHLKGERTFDRLTRARLRRLEAVVGLALPRKAVRARNTVRLHAALLDWQEIVLNQIAPERRQFDDIYDSDWNAPTPDYSTAS